MKSIRTLQPGEGCLAGTVLLLLGAALTAAPALQAQPVSFAGVQTTILDNGLRNANGLAVNNAGDVFIADSSSGEVIKVTATGIPQIIVRQLHSPQGLAVDAAGNLYISDTASGAVLKMTSSGTQTVISGLNSPRGLAVDRAGNLLIADANNNRVLKVSPSGAQSTVGDALISPSGVAVDVAGNVFISDTLRNRVVKVAPNGAQTTVTGTLNQPFGVAVDGDGNVFIADNNDNRVVKVSPNGAQTTVGSGMSHPQGVAVDRAGSLYIADTGNNRVFEMQLTAVDFGVLNICPSDGSSPAPCNRSLTLNYNISTTTNLGTSAVLTRGAENMDFKLIASRCSGVLAGGSTCTVVVWFAPLAPGARAGAVELSDSTGKVLATTLLHGQGQGAAVAFGPGIQTTLASGMNNPNSVAVDGSGNVYITESSSHLVVKVSPGGVHSEVGSGFRFPSGVAVGGAGNVFVSDSGNNRVVRVRTHGGDQTTIADGLNSPRGLAIDGAGNIFVADYYNNRVLKIAAANGAQTNLGTGLKLPSGVAVDAAGNVFIGDTMNDRVLIAAAIGAPPTTVGTGLIRPQGVAVDAVGNIFIADSGNNRAVEVQRSLAPTLTFTPTLIGQTNGPQTVTIWNIGNLRLNTVAPGLTISADYLQGPGGTAPADCSARLGMAPGGSCDLNIYFAPKTAGVKTGTVVLTDDAMNLALTTQTINLSGTAMLPTTTSVQAAAGQYSDAVTLSATVGPAGLSFAGSLQFVAGGVPACTIAVTGSGTYSCNYVITQIAQKAIIRVGLTSSDPTVQGSVGFGTLAISPEDAMIIPSTSNPVTLKVKSSGESGPFTLTARVTQASDGSLGDLSAVDSFSVSLVSGTTSIACPATANSFGTLTALCKLVFPGSYTVKWSTTDRYFHAPTVNTTLTVTP